MLRPRTTSHHKEDVACVAAVSGQCRNGWKQMLEFENSQITGGVCPAGCQSKLNDAYANCRGCSWDSSSPPQYESAYESPQYGSLISLRISFDVENGPGPVQWQNGTFCESYTAPPGGVSERFGCDKTATRLCSGSLNEWQMETNGCSCRQKVVELLLDRLVLQVGRVPPRVVPNAAPQKSAAQVFAFSPILMDGDSCCYCKT